jgi:hypothetical protein
MLIINTTKGQNKHMDTLHAPRPQEAHDNTRNMTPQDPWTEKPAPDSLADTTILSAHPTPEQDAQNWGNLSEAKDPWENTDPGVKTSATAHDSNLPPLENIPPQQESERFTEIQQNFAESATEPHYPTPEEPTQIDPVRAQAEHNESLRRNEANFQKTVTLAETLKESRPELMQGVNDYLQNTPLPTTEKPPVVDPNSFTQVNANALRERLAADEIVQQPQQPEAQPESGRPENYEGRHRKDGNRRILGRLASFLGLTKR